jgi:hypothetical protein
LFGGRMSETHLDIIKKHEMLMLMEEMKEAITGGIISEIDKIYLKEKTDELRSYFTERGTISTEDEMILNKIETTYDLIQKVESDYLNQYINYMTKKTLY